MELYFHFPHTSPWHGAYLSTGTTLPLSEGASSHGATCEHSNDSFI
jgi:hypothetical protein